jgi:hypothetical protein
LFLAKSYLSFEGIKFQNSSSNAVSIGEDPGKTSTYIKFKNCAFIGGSAGSGSPYSHTVIVSNSNHILFEDCWVAGQGRYKMHSYKSSYITYRRVVARYDKTTGVGSGNPEAYFSTYDSSNNLYLNVIGLDGDLTGTDSDTATFYLPANYTGSNNNTFMGCIALNDPLGGFTFDPSSGITSNGNSIINSVAWNVRYGVNLNGSALKNSTVNHITTGMNTRGYTTSGATGSVFKNSLVIRNSQAVYGGSPANTDYWNNSSGNTTRTINPLQKYIVRVESDSPSKGAADDGGDRGANILYAYGADDSISDTTLTSKSLWPWPNEGLIKADFAAVSNRGFTLDTSLTHYIWNFLGNGGFPGGGGGTNLVPSAPVIIGIP